MKRMKILMTNRPRRRGVGQEKQSTRMTSRRSRTTSGRTTSIGRDDERDDERDDLEEESYRIRCNSACG